MSDVLTVLSIKGPWHLVKNWLADGSIKSYGNAKNFRHAELALLDIKQLSQALLVLQSKPQSAVIRGKYIGDERATPLMREDQGWREGMVLRQEVLFEDQPHHWICIDVD